MQLNMYFSPILQSVFFFVVTVLPFPILYVLFSTSHTHSVFLQRMIYDICSGYYIHIWHNSYPLPSNITDMYKRFEDTGNTLLPLSHIESAVTVCITSSQGAALVLPPHSCRKFGPVAYPGKWHLVSCPPC